MLNVLSIATGAAFAVLATTAYAQDEAALSGLKELKIAFDVTTGNSDALVRELDVIDETRQSLMKQGIKPSIVIGFRSGATKLVQSDLNKIKPEDRANAEKIAAKLRLSTGPRGSRVSNSAQLPLAYPVPIRRMSILA